MYKIVIQKDNKEALNNNVFNSHNEVLFDCISNDSKVIDIGCGQWRSTFNLAKQCKSIVGIDYSEQTLNKAYNINQKQHKFSNIKFLKKNATNLSFFRDKEFDYANIKLTIHAASPESRIWILKEAQRVAKRLIISDFIAPLSLNLSSIDVYVSELFEWNTHFQNYVHYQKHWWIKPLLNKLNLEILRVIEDKNESFSVFEVE